MDHQLKSNLTSSKHWFRLLFMFFFAVCLQISFIVMTAVVCVQFLFALITGEDNRQLRAFGDSLSQFIYQTFEFLTYNSEQKPFPFADWPESDVETVEIIEAEEAPYNEQEATAEAEEADVVDVEEEKNKAAASKAEDEPRATETEK